MDGISYSLLLSAFLFSIGALGVLVRRNVIVVFMCVELMLNAANLALVALSNHFGDVAAQVAVFFVMAVAAAEAAVGLAIILLLFRNLKSVSADDANLLQG